MDQAQTPPPAGDMLWAIVLAAGEGTRLAPITRLLCGRDVPKQFAPLDGDHTLIQQTMDRLASIIPPERTVVVIAQDRREIAEAQLAGYPGVQIVSQPKNAGTGPGVLLPLSRVRAQARNAMVVVTPSDHHIPVRAAFLEAVQRAVEVSRRAPAGVALVGADADSPVTDLGWILPKDHGAASEAEMNLIDSFVEKPPHAKATELFKKGGLWNTFIVVASVEALWRQARRRMPRQVALFNQFVQALTSNGGQPSPATDNMLARHYRSMAPADFSRSVLQKAQGLAVVRLKGSGWCDCGTPERLLTYLDSNRGPRHQIMREILRSLGAESGLQVAP
jgi:mannose-1-phosphate guanylyltransferase